MDPIILTGHPLPDFGLPDLDGNLHRLSTYRGRVVVINFWSAECPHAARTDHLLQAYMATWGDGVRLLTIASNANENLELLGKVAQERGLPLVLQDAHQHVADLLGAVTTPHIYVIDSSGILRYQGAFDDVTFRQRTPERAYLRTAVEAVLAGRAPDPDQTPAYGCTIVRYTP